MQSIIPWYVSVVPMHLRVMFKDYPGEIYVARKDSPMILGVAEDEALYCF